MTATTPLPASALPPWVHAHTARMNTTPGASMPPPLTPERITQLRAIAAGRHRPDRHWPRHGDPARLLRPRIRDRAPFRALVSIAKDTCAALGAAIALAAATTTLLLLAQP